MQWCTDITATDHKIQIFRYGLAGWQNLQRERGAVDGDQSEWNFQASCGFEVGYTTVLCIGLSVGYHP